MPLDAPPVRIVWQPQVGPQHALVKCPVPEILFGGARGGGKSDAILGKYLIKSGQYGKDFNAVFVRRELPQADDLIERAKELYLPMGATWREQAREFRMPGGGRVRFRPIENTADAQRLQGQSISDLAIEEAGQFPDPAPIDMLFGALRSKAGVPVQMILTANPGGPGSSWLKHRYIDPAPLGMQVLTRKLPNGADHLYVYIPSRVQDNRILLENDPQYINRLHLVGSPALVKAWLDGDWSAVLSAFFPEFSIQQHVIKPLELPMYWHRFRSFDWGSARPFSVGWYAVSDGELPTYPRGALIKYREWYGATLDANGQSVPNVGLRLTAEEVADGILKREEQDLIGNRQMSGVADPSIFAQDGGPSIADRMAARKVFFREADNTRVGRLGHLGGWDQVRARLKGDGEKPAIYFFSTCRDIIRTLPVMQHDQGRPEDADSDGEDHACFVAGTVVNGRPIEAIGALTRRLAETVVLTFSDGYSVECTPDHRFLTADGRWERADRLKSIRLWSALPAKSSWAGAIGSAANTICAMVVDCIGWSGSIIEALSRRGTMSITLMATAPTMPLPTSPCWPQLNTSLCTARNTIQPLRARSGGLLTRLAGLAGSFSRRSLSAKAGRAPVVCPAESVLCESVRKPSRRQDVYCLGTRAGWVRLDNGIVAANCDELRYACMSRPYTAPLPPELEPERDRYTRKWRPGGMQRSGWAA